MSDAERALREVPRWVLGLLAASLAAQLAWQAARGAPRAEAEDLPRAPSARALAAASFGEPQAAARLAMLYLQAFDSRGGNRIAYRQLDYARVAAWLEAILEADPKSGYPLFAAARIYAENPDPARCRAMLELVYRAYFADPERRWPWLAHAALLAKHRLGDLGLARRYAQAIERHTADPAVPLWAKQMEIFILEDMDEIEAARIMLGGLIASGKVTDPGELRFLQGRLKELEERLGKGRTR